MGIFNKKQGEYFMRINPILILDTLFCAFVSFILSFILFYYFLPRPLAITLSVTACALLSLYFIKRGLKKQIGIKLSLKNKKECDQLLTTLKFCTTQEQCEIFCAPLKNKYSIQQKKGGIFIKDKNCAIFPLFSFENLTKTDVVKIFNRISSSDTAYILCDDHSNEIKTFIDRFDGRIKLFDQNDAYLFLKENQSLPQVKNILTEKKPLTLSAFKDILQKKKAKTLLGFGLTFLVMSYFVSIKIYYLICGCVFLFLALLCRLYGK